MAKVEGEEYEANFRKIQELVGSASPFDVLSHFAYYDLLFLDQSVEEKKSEYERLRPAHVELLQAFCLSVPVEQLSNKPAPPHLYSELNSCLQVLMRAFSLRRLADKPDDDSVLSVEMIRMHTQLIRNQAHPDQIFKFLTNVFQPLDADMEKMSGFKPSLLVVMISRLLQQLEDAANGWMNKLLPVIAASSVEDAVRAYYKLLATDENVQRMLELCQERKWNLFEAKSVLISHYDLELWKCYEFSTEDFLKAYPEPIAASTMKALLEQWSCVFGEFAGQNKEHFFLNNPVWKKPIIRTGEDSYFWPLLFQSFIGFGLEMFESLIDQHPSIKTKYESEVRSKYLEDEAERIFKSSLPRSTVLRGSLWHDPVTNKGFENDLLILLDSFLVVVECKSGAIPPSARRGGQRLEAAVNELIKEPAEQSSRFAEFLISHRGQHTFQTKRGVQNNCDTTKIRHVIRLSLTVDFFGPLTSQSRLLQKSGFLKTQIPPAVTMPIVALETVFEFLEGVHQKLHYLSRRSGWEAHIDCMADEYDLLTFYMATGFNVGSFEFGQDQHLMIYGLSGKLDHYFRAKALGKPIPKPALKLTQWWKDILKNAEERSFDGWTDVGMFLLDANRQDQWTFEKTAEKLQKNVRAHWQEKGHNNFLIGATGPEQRQKAISAYAYKDHISREERDKNLGQIFGRVADETRCKEIIVIGIDADERRYPYQFIAFSLGVEKNQIQP